MLAIILFGAYSIAQVATPSPFVVEVKAPTKDFLDYLIALAQLGALIGLIIYVIKTWQIAGANRQSVQVSERVLKEMRASRFQEIAPYVVVYLDMPYGKDWVMFLVVKNTGRTVAKNIRFKVDPALATSFTSSGTGSKPFDIYLLREGITSLAPGQEIRTPFDTHLTHKRENLPTVYKVELSFDDSFQSKRTIYEQTLDLSIFSELEVLEKKGQDDLIKAVETIAHSSGRLERYGKEMADSLEGGVWLNNPETLGSGDMSLEAWTAQVASKLNEILLLWKNIHAGSFERPFRLLPEELKKRLGVLASQLLLITSYAKPTVPLKTKEELVRIIIRLYELRNANFRPDRGESYQKFNASGDEMAQLAAEIVVQLTSGPSIDANTHPAH